MNFPHGEKHCENTVVYSSSLAVAFLFCNNNIHSMKHKSIFVELFKQQWQQQKA